MDRYQIARKSPESIVYRCNTTTLPSKITNVMKRCIYDRAIFDINNLNESSVNSALVKLSKEINVPVIIDSLQRSRILSISYGRGVFYHLSNFESIPANLICYWDMDPSTVTPVRPLLILRKGVKE